MKRRQESSARPVRVALIGYGLAGSVFHAPLIASTKDMVLSAVVTANPDRQTAAIREHPGVEVLRTTDQLFTNAREYDLVVVATPNDTHASLAIAAMNRGLAVVVDKPFALSVEEAQEVIAVREKSGCALAVFQNRRWDNDFLTIRELISKHMLGKITRFESRYERWRPQPKLGGWRETVSAAQGGGLLFDLGSHLIDQAIVLFGKPQSVYAELKARRSAVKADDDSFIALQCENDICVHLWVSLMARVPGARFRVLGNKGMYEKFGMDPQEEALKSGMRPGHPAWGLEPPDMSGHLYATVDGIEMRGKVTSKAGSYQTFYEEMRAAVADGEPVPVTAEEALLTLTVIEAARKSATERASVAI